MVAALTRNCGYLRSKVSDIKGVTFHGQGVYSEKDIKGANHPGNFTTLPQSMKDNAITWVDVLKIDVEGAEWSIFLEYFDTGSPLPFTQILVEIHLPAALQISEDVFGIVRRFFGGMDRAGYRIFSAS